MTRRELKAAFKIMGDMPESYAEAITEEQLSWRTKLSMNVLHRVLPHLLFGGFIRRKGEGTERSPYWYWCEMARMPRRAPWITPVPTTTQAPLPQFTISDVSDSATDGLKTTPVPFAP